MNATRAFVEDLIKSTINQVSSITTIPVAINARSIWHTIKSRMATAAEQLKITAHVPVLKARAVVKQCFDRASHLEVADPEAYKLGEPATKNMQTPTATFLIADAESFVGKNVQNAKANLLFLDKSVGYTVMAIGLALVLILLTAFGLGVPLIKELMGDNGSISDINALGWATLISLSISLAVAASSLTFMGPSRQRLAPWVRWTVMMAAAAILGRYVAREILVNFELMDSLSRDVQRVIQLVASIGTGVALLLLDASAGRLLAYGWMRMGQLKDRQLFQQFIADADAWHAARVALATTEYEKRISDNVTEEELIPIALDFVSDAVNRGLEPHRARLAALKSQSGTYAGTRLEGIDAITLEHQIASCDKALDDLYALAASAPSSKATPTTPAIPPAPMPAIV